MGLLMMREAMLYEQEADQRVRCLLCAHRCIIQSDGRGTCQVRENQEGTLYSLVYGDVIAEHVDPIEKKPLFHFAPGSLAYSIATPGCNFRCAWCQNYDISQMPRDQQLAFGIVGSRTETPPEAVVKAAQAHQCHSIAYTYTEPTIFFEYTYDIARLAHDYGLANVYVTNGYMTSEMLQIMHPHLDAANVDLKAFRDETYRRYIGARLQPVLDSLKQMKQLGIWIEVTTLLIPEVNDSSEELQDAARFIAEELGPETPWHLSRFYPTYKMTATPPTPESTLTRALDIGKQAGLQYVYAGNSQQNIDTRCHVCGSTLVRRIGYRVVKNAIAAGEGTGSCVCAKCRTPVAGIALCADENDHREGRDRQWP
jgi:pyruvate formate lyase activating enzyme